MQDDTAPVPIEVPAPDPAGPCSQVRRSLLLCFCLERTEPYFTARGMFVGSLQQFHLMLCWCDAAVRRAWTLTATQWSSTMFGIIFR